VGISKCCKARKLGKVAFVVEGGQPNVGYVKEVLEFMRTRERYEIASVTIGNKKVIQLYAADFLAHSCTSDSKWFDRITATCDIFEDDTTPEKITRMSAQITTNLRRLRRERREEALRRRGIIGE
jgi:hypothetical protein